MQSFARGAVRAGARPDAAPGRGRLLADADERGIRDVVRVGRRRRRSGGSTATRASWTSSRRYRGRHRLRRAAARRLQKHAALRRAGARRPSAARARRRRARPSVARSSRTSTRLYAQVLERLEPVMESAPSSSPAARPCSRSPRRSDVDAGRTRLRPRRRATRRGGAARATSTSSCAPIVPQQCTDYARQIWNALAVDGEFWKFERGRGVLNMAFLFEPDWDVRRSSSRSCCASTRRRRRPDVLRRRLLLRRDLLIGYGAWKNWRVWALPRRAARSDR